MAKRDPNKIYNIAVGDISDEGLLNIESITATKDLAIKWLNKMIVKHYDRTGNSFTLFNMDYNSQKELDIDEWQTIEELNELGLVKLV